MGLGRSSSAQGWVDARVGFSARAGAWCLRETVEVPAMVESTQWRSGLRFWALILVLIAGMGCGASEEGDDGVMPNPVTGATAGTGGPSAGMSGGIAGVTGSSAGISGGTAGAMARAGTGGGMAVAGSGGMTAGGTGAAGIGTSGTGGMGASGTGGMGASGGQGGAAPPSEGGCTPPPAGTFQTMTETGTGPDGNYTIFRPSTLGENGFLHPPVAWGNGLATTPSLYTAQLNEVASHGFVIIANPGTGSDPQVVRAGLEWLLEQNASGEYAGKLAVDCAGTIGYSMGGGAAVGSGSHPAVKAIVSIHGLQDAADRASGPILLTTSEGDTFVTKSGFVEPCYNRSSVQPTILASHSAGDHLDPLGMSEDWEPAIAWLRYWIYGDQSQKAWFFGEDCTLCDWPDFRRKNHPEWQ
jgi:hypothetical protein